MPTFLDLPREIRDEIYTYCLISPSGLIAPYLLPRSGTVKLSRRRVKPSKQTHQPDPKHKQLHLISDPLVLGPKDTILRTPDTFLAECKSAYLSLSLPAACRQIYNETQGMFWGRNTFYFEGFGEEGRGLGVGRSLKFMGQTASRMIERMTIRMPSSKAEYKGLRKVLKILSSRARLGNFKTLELVWMEEELMDLMGVLYGNPVFFDGLLDDLKWGFEGERFERVVRIPACPVAIHLSATISIEAGDDRVRQMYEEVARCLHYSIGGRMFCGGAENGVGLGMLMPA